MLFLDLLAHYIPCQCHSCWYKRRGHGGSGSSATNMSFELFRKIGTKTKIPVEAVKRPDATLRDYNQRPIPIGACIDLELEWQGKSVNTTVYLRSDLGTHNEHVF